MIGKVQRWGWRGYGFIESAALPVTAWFHFKHIAANGYLPRVGDEVEFEPAKVDENKYEAHRVRPVPAPSSQTRSAPVASPPATGTPTPQTNGAVTTPSIAKLPVLTQPAATAFKPLDSAEIATLAKAGSMKSILERLGSDFARDQEAVTKAQQAQQQRVVEMEATYAQAERAFKIAGRNLDEAKKGLECVRAEAAKLPALQAERRAQAINQFIHTLRLDFEASLKERRRRLKNAEAARSAAISSVGEAAVKKYESVRDRAAKEADAMAREAFQQFERKEREQLKDYAAALDQLDATGTTPFRFLRVPEVDGWSVVVSPLASNADDGDDWRLFAAFLEAAERAARELAIDKPEAVQYVGVEGSAAIRVRAKDLEDLFAFLLDEVISTRPTLRPLALAPAVESVSEVTLLASPCAPNGERAARQVVPIGGTLADVAKRMGVRLRVLVSKLRDHDLAAPDDLIDAGTESTLARLLGIDIAPAREVGPQQTPQAPPIRPTFTTVEEAVAAVIAEFPNRIRLQANSQSCIKGNPFDDVESFYRALRFLTTTYFEAKTGAVPCSNFDEALRRECGFFFRSSQSDVTMGEFASDYETWWDGRRVKLEDHIGKGDSKDARTTIRVAWHWDAKARVVVIGFIGQHQRTRAT